MTTLTLVFALMPLLLGAGAGSEIRAPMAAVVIGGSISSTMLTLILVPVVYNFFDWGGGLVSRAFRGIFGMPEPGDQPPLVVDGVPDPTPTFPPSPQPGSAISTSSPSPEPEPDAA
jgi:HAE1 family hydrophobic/amphiphilic exporter-1